MKDIAIRKANIADATWMAPLCYQQFQVAHKEALRPDDLEYLIDMLFNEASVTEDLTDQSNVYFVAEVDGTPMGCTKLSQVSLDLGKDVKDAMELTRVYVHPDYIGKGIGSKLMEHIIGWSKEHGISSLWLHVYVGNHTAIDFYDRWGFQKMGTQDYPVRSSCPIGWVMRKLL